MAAIISPIHQKIKSSKKQKSNEAD